MPGERQYAGTARLLTFAAFIAAAPMLIASIALGAWLTAAEKSVAGQVVLLCVAAAAAAALPLLLAFAAGLEPQASAMRYHAESLKRHPKVCSEGVRPGEQLI